MCIFRDPECSLSKGISVSVPKDGERSVRRATSGEFPVEARGDIEAQIVRYIRFLEVKDKSNHLEAVFCVVFQ